MKTSYKLYNWLSHTVQSKVHWPFCVKGRLEATWVSKFNRQFVYTCDQKQPNQICALRLVILNHDALLKHQLYKSGRYDLPVKPEKQKRVNQTDKVKVTCMWHWHLWLLKSSSREDRMCLCLFLICCGMIEWCGEFANSKLDLQKNNFAFYL